MWAPSRPWWTVAHLYDEPPPPEPPAPPPAPEPKTYTEEQVQSRLAGQGKELDRTKAQLQALQAKVDADKKKALEEQGRFRDLHEQSTSELGTTKAELAATQKRLAAFEAAVAAEVEASLKGIEDKALRGQMTELLKDRPIEDQKAILAVAFGARKKAGPTAPSVDVGAPGRPASGPPDWKTLTGKPDEMRTASIAALEEWRKAHS